MRFDTNGDGVLSWEEVLPLVNTLYNHFGLQPPREGNLRSFFEATDRNKAWGDVADQPSTGIEL